MDAFIGTVLPVAFNYPPRGWLFCNGQTVPIAQNSAAFALFGTMYGGDGQQTFGIPDLRGRAIFGSQGNGPGLQSITQGQKAGTNTVTLIANNLPQHSHPATLNLSGLSANTTISVGTATTGGTTVMAAGSTLTSTLAPPSANSVSAAIYLPTGTPQTAPQNLGGVNTTVSATGGSVTVQNNVSPDLPISIMPPYLGLNYIIAMEGIFPSRN